MRLLGVEESKGYLGHLGGKIKDRLKEGDVQLGRELYMFFFFLSSSAYVKKNLDLGRIFILDLRQNFHFGFRENFHFALKAEFSFWILGGFSFCT